MLFKIRIHSVEFPDPQHLCSIVLTLALQKRLNVLNCYGPSQLENMLLWPCFVPFLLFTHGPQKTVKQERPRKKYSQQKLYLVPVLSTK